MKLDRQSHRPATLGDLAGKGLDVWAWCNGCHHHAVLPVAPLVARLGRNHAVPAVSNRARCAQCGSRDVETRPHWPATGVVTRHATGQGRGLRSRAEDLGTAQEHTCGQEHNVEAERAVLFV